MRKIAFGMMVVGSIVAGSWLIWPHSLEITQTKPEKLRVAVSFFPYGEFARAVAGDLADVSELVPAGVEPHDFEPTPRDMEQLYRADVVIINGAGIDAWAEKAVRDLPEHGTRVIRMSQGIDLLSGSDDISQGQPDPHFWLDPVLAEVQVERIAEVLSEVDPVHQDQYQFQAQAFIGELRSLDAEYRQGLATCRLHTVVTSHDAFTYLAKRYTLKTIAIAGLSPDAEPSPQRLAAIARQIQELGVRVIFFETLASPKLAETLAREEHIETLVFDPIEGAPIVNGRRATYTGLMQENLRNLRRALECL